MKKFKLFLFAAVLLSSIGLHASNTITYTASAQLPGNYGSLDVGETTFGPAITSHTFSNGTGTITCNGEITKIGDDAFYYCSDLTSITIPNSVTTIGNQAFELCIGLVAVEIPNSVKTIGDEAFFRCSNLTSATIGNSVTSIGNDAFYNCTSLNSITIPNSVKTVGDGAFSSCKGLTSATIGNSVTTIGNSAFSGCSSLPSIKIPYSVTTIGGDAFENCSGLTSVTVFWADKKLIPSINSFVFKGIAHKAGPAGATLHIPSGTAALYQQADVWNEFGSMIDDAKIDTITYSATSKLSVYSGSLDVGATTFGSAIISHEFSNGTGTIICDGEITTIGENAFYTCISLTAVEIPNSVTTIGNSAFVGCTGLTSITIPNSVTTIGDQAFRSCTSLTSIAIPNSVTTIGSSAFEYCSGLTSVTIPNSVTRIGDNAFAYCSGLTSVTVFWTDEKSIPSIDSNVFSEIADHKGPSGAILFILEGTEELYRQADVWKDFGSIVEHGIITYTAPTKVWGGSGSLNVGRTTFGPAIISHEFSNGTGTIICDGKITKIENYAFHYCSSLTSVTIPNSVTTIEGRAFEYCSGLTSVTIPNSVTRIGDNAFAYCGGLTSVTIGNSVTTIGDYAFFRCTGLTSITIPNSVTTIGNYAFKSCGGLTSVTIPNSVTTIGDDAFADCRGLTSVTIGNSVTTIGYEAFDGCSSLTSVTIGNSVKTIGERAFRSCGGLTSIEIPNSVTTIGHYAFKSCGGLTSVTIPNSVTTIGNYAFNSCDGLTSVTIGNSVKTIGEYAFYDCSGLTVVTVSWTDKKSIPSIDSNVFEGIAHGFGPNGAKLHVPKGTKELYQQADGWKEFGDIEDIIKINNLWYRSLNVRTANVIANQDTTATGERIPYTGDIIINKTAGLYDIAAIEDSVFYNAELTSLTVLTDIPLPCEQYTFLGQDKSIPVYVLDVDAFKRAQYWNKFTNIQFYAPYRDEAKQKLIDAANSVPEEHSAEAKAIAEAYGKKMDGLNTAAAIDKLYAQAMEEIQAFMDEALWTLDKTGCMTLPKP